MYECPIQKITRELQTQITQQDEEKVLLEVKQSVGFFVDKEELIKALSYDREQYQKGYVDGLKVIDDIKAEIYEEFMTIDGKVYDKSAIKCMEIIGKYKGNKE